MAPTGGTSESGPPGAQGWSTGPAAVTGIVLAAAAVSYVASSLLVGHAFGLARCWPFAQERAALQPIVGYWWPAALAMVLTATGLLAKWLRPPLGLMVVGLVLVGIALIGAVRPIPSYPQRASGVATCRALLFGSGPHGDADEVCFDVRTARKFDTDLAAMTGLLLGGIGVALVMFGRSAIDGADPDGQPAGSEHRVAIP